jgi:hypothetical protein
MGAMSWKGMANSIPSPRFVILMTYGTLRV